MDTHTFFVNVCVQTNKQNFENHNVAFLKKKGGFYLWFTAISINATADAWIVQKTFACVFFSFLKNPTYNH